MLDIAETLDPLLDARARHIEQVELGLEDEDIDEYTAETTLQLIFFDGEEAFIAWSATDSIYGARSVPSFPPSPPCAHSLLPLFFFSLSHLAASWASTYLPPHPKRRLISAATPTTPLSTIDHLVLLDLLGAPHPQVRSYFPDTAWLFDVLVSAETRLRDAGILDAAALGGSFFHNRAASDISMAYMGDDHLPFLHRGVSVLHVIAEPFPHVWHTLGVSIDYHAYSCFVALLWWLF
jgi:glutaminyl-peptide cyclotransferase